MLRVTDWGEVDGALEDIGLLELELTEVTTSMGRRLHDVFSEYSGRISDLGARRTAIESAIQVFCLLNKSEFAKKRSRRLNYGKIAFRTAERIDVPEELQEAAIATLKKLGLSECIEIRERLDKGALKKLTDTDLARCGIKRTREDHFRIEPDLNLISEKFGKRQPSGPVFGVAVEKLIDLLIRNDEPAQCAVNSQNPPEPKPVAATAS